MRSYPCLLLVALAAMLLAACAGAGTTPSPVLTRVPTPILPTPRPISATLADDQEGLFLVAQGQAIPMSAQYLGESESIYGAGLPEADDPQPIVLLRSKRVNTANLALQHMVGSIGLMTDRDLEAHGLLVKGVRAGFGAETAGLQPGDVIVAIDGQSLDDIISRDSYLDDIGPLITGEIGSIARLTVKRAGQEVELRAVRNFPTIWSQTSRLHYETQQNENNVTALFPDQPLSAGVYCYVAGSSATTMGVFYCFQVGDLNVAWPVRPTPVARATPAPGGTAGPGAAALQPTDCRFPLRSGQSVDCFDLIVPEDRSQPQGKMIRLHVAVFRTSSAPRPDAVIFLHGGPGGGALDWIAETYDAGFQYLFPGRDFIAFDQRGTGYSQPRLACPSLAGEYAASLAKDERVSMLAWEAAHMGPCRADLIAQGVNLAAYTSAANAADLHDLIQALGYEQVDLYGQSYGTYLALTYLKEYGAEGRIRSAVLEGVDPPQTNLFTARGANAQRAFSALFAACAADSACLQNYPDLEATFYGLLERLDSQPVTVQATNRAAGAQQDVVVNSYRLIETLYRSIYQANWIPRLPKLIADADRGDYTLLSAALENVFGSSSSVDTGIYYAILCNDEAPFATVEAVVAADAALPAPLRAYFDGTGEAILGMCAGWQAAPAGPDGKVAVVSDVPTLLLSGSFDPITPPAWASLVAGTLSKGFAYEFPAEGHGVLGTSSCAQAITVEFLETLAEPHPGCLNNLPGPAWEVP